MGNKMEYQIEYDKSSPSSIEAYSQGLIGKTFRQIIEADNSKSGEVAETFDYGSPDASASKRNKGNLGQTIEENFFHYACNNDSRPDFHEAGVELKVTPYKKNKNGSLSAKERLILTMIDYCSVVGEEFETSHFWTKAKLILLVYYLYEPDIRQNIDYKISYSRLFTPPERDLRIIKHDFEYIVAKIKAGKAHELSEGDTMYLGAAPKAATSKDRRKQPNSAVLAKPRAFAFKNSYMTYILNNYIVPGKDTYEKIIEGDCVDSFEEFVVEKIGKYKGRSVDELVIEFDIDISRRPKNLEALLAYRMLGIKNNRAEEFEKANIVVKAIRIGSNGKIRESMSFPAFKFKELVQEEWEDSTFGNYLRETRFLFVIYKYDRDEVLRLQGSQFWNIPYDDLETEVRSVWEKTVSVLKSGLEINIVNGVRYSNLPKASENRVCHVRPHAQNALDTYELPDGRLYPKQCFWLNNSYILSQIKEDLK